MAFERIILFAIQVGERSARDGEAKFVRRMAELERTEFWFGRGISIEEDFPNIEEQKFWARAFLDLARLIFDREVGSHDSHVWQAGAIYHATAIGLMFEEAVNEQSKNWRAETIDRNEFHGAIKSIRPSDDA